MKNGPCFDGGPCEHQLNGLPRCSRGCAIEAAIANRQQLIGIKNAAARGNYKSSRIMNRIKNAKMLPPWFSAIIGNKP